MKLLELLKITDPCSSIVIWTPDCDEEPEFRGFIIDTPWYLAERTIINGLDDNTCSIRVNNDTNGEAVMVVSVDDEER